MQSKNKPAPTKAEREHIERIKLMPCIVCDEGGGRMQPSECHEVEQGQWFTSLPLCAGCHRSEFNGIHGQARIWSVKRMTEMSALNEFLRSLLTT